MTSEQLVPALIASLLLAGVEPPRIEEAVARVRSLQVGDSLSGNMGRSPLYRAFAHEQARLLESAL